MQLMQTKQSKMTKSVWSCILYISDWCKDEISRKSGKLRWNITEMDNVYKLELCNYEMRR